jgi:hypothetical protein
LTRIVYKIAPSKTDERILWLEKVSPYIKQELVKTGLTSKLLWEEYKTEHKGGYEYEQFCVHFSQYLKRNIDTIPRKPKDKPSDS